MIGTTVVLLKPDAINRGLVGEILTRFERVGLILSGLKLIQATPDQAQRHYQDLLERYGPEVHLKNVRMLTDHGPILAMAVSGDEAVTTVRKLVGSTYPQESAPGTIRGDYCHVSKAQAQGSGQPVWNVIHASSSPDEAKRELDIWFQPEEIQRHSPAYAQRTVYGN